MPLYDSKKSRHGSDPSPPPCLFGNVRISKAPSLRDLSTLAFFKNCLANSLASIKIEEEGVPVVPTLGLLNPWCGGCWQSLNSCKIGRALSKLKQYFHGQAQTWKKDDLVIASGQLWAWLSSLKISNFGKVKWFLLTITMSRKGRYQIFLKVKICYESSKDSAINL